MTRAKGQRGAERIVWRLTDYDTADESFYCSRECAEADMKMCGDWGDPEDVTEDSLEESRDEKWVCDFCHQPIVKPARPHKTTAYVGLDDSDASD